MALHLSGVLPAAALGTLAERGYAVGSLHPLQTVADPARGAERLRGAYFTFEGDPAAHAAAAEIVEAAAGRMLEVHATEKARYHAACVFASNYVVACAAVATRLLATAANIAEAEAARALQPLWGGGAGIWVPEETGCCESGFRARACRGICICGEMPFWSALPGG